MTYARNLVASLFAELSRPTPVIHVMIGPRQVGKTTIARQIQEPLEEDFPRVDEGLLPLDDIEI